MSPTEGLSAFLFYAPVEDHKPAIINNIVVTMSQSIDTFFIIENPDGRNLLAVISNYET